MLIELMIGMIGSGKSTYALSRARQGAFIVAHDDLCKMLHGEYRYEQENRQLYRELEEGLIETLILSSKDVVIDRTHLTLESRARWIDFANYIRDECGILDVEIVAVAFPIEDPKLHAMRRWCSDNRGRTGDDWFAVAKHHHSQVIAEPLSDDEGFDRIVRMTWEEVTQPC